METKTLHFVLPDRDGSHVFVCPGSDGLLRLPKFDEPVSPDVGFESPPRFNDWFQKRFGIAVHRRYLLAPAESPDILFVLEPAAESGDGPIGGEWIHHANAAELYAGESLIHDAMLSLPRDYIHAVTMPWVRPGGFQPHLRWLSRAFANLGYISSSISQVKNTYLSTIFRCATNHGDVYLKIPGLSGSRELIQTQTLLDWGLIDRPQLLAFDEGLGTILMSDLGGNDLPRVADEHQLHQVCDALANLQLRSRTRIKKDPCPFYDLQMPVILERLESLVETAATLLAHSKHKLSVNELAAVASAIPTWRKLLEKLLVSSLPTVIDHGDLYPLNIRLTEDRVVFYDWAEVGVAHPFLAAVQMLFRTQVQDGTQSKRAIDSDEIKLRYLERWKEFASLDTLTEEFRAADDAKHLCLALTNGFALTTIRQLMPPDPVSMTSADALALDCREEFYAQLVRRVAQLPAV